jgi:hypothetical protein
MTQVALLSASRSTYGQTMFYLRRGLTIRRRRGTRSRTWFLQPVIAAVVAALMSVLITPVAIAQTVGPEIDRSGAPWVTKVVVPPSVTVPESTTVGRSAVAALAVPDPCVRVGWNYQAAEVPLGTSELRDGVVGGSLFGLLARHLGESATPQNAYRLSGRTPGIAGNRYRVQFWSKKQRGPGTWKFKILSNSETAPFGGYWSPSSSSFYDTNTLVDVNEAAWAFHSFDLVSTATKVRFTFWNDSVALPESQLDLSELRVFNCGEASSNIALVGKIVRVVPVGGSTSRRYNVVLTASGLTVGRRVTFTIVSQGHSPSTGSVRTITPTSTTEVWQYELTNPRGVFTAQLFVDGDGLPDQPSSVKEVVIK